MAKRPRSGSTETRTLFTDLVLEVFRLNGALIASGNALCQGTGLTSARWQVLGAIALAAEPLTVAQIARVMGLTRQAVQRVVDALESAGVVRRLDHPESLRARPVQLTEAGGTLYAAMMRRQGPWAVRAATGIVPTDLETAIDVLRLLRMHLEAELDEGW